tara:strand:- start:1996 stop:2835 length:840 start_codon:yes stop_codon:yes gene_type:complete
MKLFYNNLNIHFKNSNSFLQKRYIVKAIENPLPGIDIGIPLTIFQNTYTTLHYGENIINFKDIALQFLIGYYVYGTDRYNDAIDYHYHPYNTTKSYMYQNIYKNKIFVYKCILFSYLTTIYLLMHDQYYIYNIPFLFLLQILNNYKKMKPALGPFKPVFISIMWTICAIGIPSVLHDHNYDIFYHPQDYLPCTLTLFSCSNIIDNKDIREDSINGINTIPVLYGKDTSNYISLLSIIASSTILGMNHNYLQFPIQNSILEIQNSLIAFLPFVINGTKPY